MWFSDPTLGEGPDYWERTTLGELCKSGNGHIQTGPFGSQLHASDYVPVGVPSIMPVNLGNKRVIRNEIKQIAEDNARKLERHRVKPGDLIYSRRGDVERHALITEKEVGWLCGTGCIKIRLGNCKVLPAFASYYLSHPMVKDWISRHAVGSTMPNLNTTIMGSVPFLVPPLAEQHAIARILGALDDKIEINRQMNHTLEELAQAVFKSWFVDFDPVTAKAAGKQPFDLSAEAAALFPDTFVDSELGPIPAGWRVVVLKEVFNLTMGQSPPGSTYNEIGQGLPFFQGRTDFGIRFPSRRVFCSAPTRTAFPGDTLVTVRAPVGDINMVLEKCCVGRGLAAVQHKEGYRAYTYYAMKNLQDAFDIYNGEGTLFGAINKTAFETIKLIYAGNKLTEQFEKQAFALDELIKSNEIESAHLAELRDALLSKLLSGEIRVTQAEQIVAKVISETGVITEANSAELSQLL